MSITGALDLMSALARTRAELADIGRPAYLVHPGLGVPGIQEEFRSNEGLTCLVVRDPESDALGILMRSTFAELMAGGFGFGRALLGKRTIAELADWEALVVPVGTEVPAAVQAAMTREGPRRYDDLLVDAPDGVRVVTTARLVETLAGLFAHRAVTDELTGLANRALFFAHLVDECERVSAGGGHLGVVYVDLDHFKSVNDRYGHGAGDALLTAVGHELAAVRGPRDVVARLGGDEFAVLLRLSGADDHAGTAARAAERYQAAALRAIDGNGVRGCSASIGVAVSVDGAADPDTLLREADLAMYDVKEAGGGGVRLVPGVGRALAPSRLMPTLGQMIDAGWLVLDYQPIIELATHRVAALEALVRCDHPTLGRLAPAEFLPQACGNDLRRLDDWVLGQVARDLATIDALLGGATPIAVNVNLTAASVEDGDLAERVCGVLADDGAVLSRLRLEVPEGADFAQLTSAAVNLGELRALGVRITLDDVGAGATSLRHLSALAVDGIKIDRSFVAGMVDNSRDLALVRMLVELANHLGLRVTAEGVETPEQLELLRSIGCGHAQGFHLGRPQPLEALSPPRGVAPGSLAPPRSGQLPAPNIGAQEEPTTLAP